MNTDPSFSPLRDDRAPPAGTDVVIVGGGIAGVATALFLAERGLRAVLCEKGRIAGEQSSRNWGWVRQMGRDPAELPLAIESLNLWRQLDARFGIDTGFRETGITYLCRTRREETELTEWARIGRAHDLPVRLLGGGEIAALLPGIAPGARMALHTANDGRAEPALAVPAMARAARARGVRIIESCAVRGVETSAGRVSAAVTERGTINCGAVVLAGGAWSRLFAGNLGLDLPQLRILASAARVGAVDGVPDMPVGGSDFAFRRRRDGGFTIALRNANLAPILPDSFRLLTDFLPTFLRTRRELTLSFGRAFFTDLATPRRWPLDRPSPFEAARVLDPAPHEAFNRKALKTLATAFPAFAGATITDSWAGMIDATPDALPVIGPVDPFPGLHLATGFSGHGFGIGPAAGLLMAQLLAGETPCVDPAPFRLARFRGAGGRDHPAATNATSGA